MNELTGPQVREIIMALTARHKAQAEAMKRATKRSETRTPYGLGMTTEEGPTVQFSEDFSDAQLALLGINVIESHGGT